MFLGGEMNLITPQSCCNEFGYCLYLNHKDRTKNGAQKAATACTLILAIPISILKTPVTWKKIEIDSKYWFRWKNTTEEFTVCLKICVCMEKKKIR